MKNRRILEISLLVLILAAFPAKSKDWPRQPLESARSQALEIIPEWLQGIGSLIAAVTSLFLLYQVVLLKRQLTQGAEQLRQAKQQLESGIQWNKLNAAFTYFNSDVVLQKERSAARSLVAVGFDLHNGRVPLAPAQVDDLKKNFEQFADVKDFLNLIEDYCTAVRIGAIDDDAAYAMMGGMVIRWNQSLHAFIEERRKSLDDPDVFCELENLARAWGERDAQTRQKREAELEEARRRMEQQKGVQRKVP